MLHGRFESQDFTFLPLSIGLNTGEASTLLLLGMMHFTCLEEIMGEFAYFV